MPTNKIALRSTEEFMQDYTPVYSPIYPLLLGKSQAYPEQVGTIDFRRAQTVGDIRAHRITPKDSELQQIQVSEAKKTFKKYFLANQFIQSNLQDRQGNEDVIKQVLDEHQVQADELLLFGEGTAANNVLNNGLYWSSDENYTLESAVAAADLTALHEAVMTTKRTADKIAGRKLVIFYGENTCANVDSIYSTSSASFKDTLAKSMGPNFSQAMLPESVTPASAEGWIIVNLDQIKLHYTTLPKLLAQGVNEEKMYSWHNFIMGSMMVECLAANAIVRQPRS